MLQNLKRTISQMPFVGDVFTKIHRRVRGNSKPLFVNSAEYWDARYSRGGNSGTGSYNELAWFKAEILNEFVRTHTVSTVLEFGCGDGAQLALADYPNYLGLDVSETAIELCKTRYNGDRSKQFHVIGSGQAQFTADLTLSLDVIYHLVEDAVFHQYMTGLFDASRKYVAIYASNEDRRGEGPHLRHRRFTAWIEQRRPNWRQIGFVKNRYPWDEKRPGRTSFADFYFFEKSPDASR